MHKFNIYSYMECELCKIREFFNKFFGALEGKSLQGFSSA